MSDEQGWLADFVADRLRTGADALVAEWAEWIRSRSAGSAAHASALRELEDGMPPVIRSLGGYLADSTTAVREEMLGPLRTHGRIRRDQGYDAGNVISELDGLADIVVARMKQELLASGRTDALDDVLTVFERLSAGLRAMTSVTLSAYQEAERDRRRELGRRLAAFGRTIGHALRSPLNSIALSATVLDNDRLAGDAEQRREQTDIIRSSVRQAEGLLYDIDLLAMVEGASTAPHMSPLPAVLESVRGELGARADRSGVALEFQPDAPRLAVETMVAQLVLTSVVNNAIRYGDAAKDVRWVKVDVMPEYDSEGSAFVCLSVTDNGVGMSEELRSRVFQRGFRAHPERAEGTGLGLAVTRELVQERGGRVELDSEEGAGTRVDVVLPAGADAST